MILLFIYYKGNSKKGRGHNFEPPNDPELPKLSKFHYDCLNLWYYDSSKKIWSESKYPDSITDCTNFTSTFPEFKYIVNSNLQYITPYCKKKLLILFRWIDLGKKNRIVILKLKMKKNMKWI